MQVFLVAELSNMVLECLGRDNLPSVVSLATTCRALYEAAMDALWAELQSISPLVKCLPQDAWEEEVCPGLGHENCTVLVSLLAISLYIHLLNPFDCRRSPAPSQTTSGNDMH